MCNALQKERKILYDKIKEVRQSNSNVPSIIFGSFNPEDDSEGADKSAELQKIQEADPVLTEDMARLKEEQAKLQQFAASLLATAADKDEEDHDDVDLEEDPVASAFLQFKTKTQIKEEPVSQSVPQTHGAEEAQKTDPPSSEEKPSEAPTEPKPGAEYRESQQQLPEPKPQPETVKIDLPTDTKPGAAETKVPYEAGEVKPVVPADDRQVQQQPAEPVQLTEAAPKPPAASPKAAASTESSNREAPKKKKKKNSRNVC